MIGIDKEKAKLKLNSEFAKENGEETLSKLDSGQCGDISGNDLKEVDVAFYKAILEAKREELTSGSIQVNGICICVDAASRREMQHYVTEAIINGLVNVHWKLKDGSFHTYTVQEFKPVYKTVVGYINACFGNQKELQSALDNASDPSTVNLDSGWPTKTYTV